MYRDFPVNELIIITLAVLLITQLHYLNDHLLSGPFIQNASSIIRVPQDASLQEAIYRVDDGGIIEISGGTYASPAGGFVISDLGKGFTIRASQGEEVVLSGNNSNEIITFINSSKSSGKLVVFEGLTFANGLAASDGRAGAITMQRAKARFVRCTFRNNKGEQPSTGGGAVLVSLDSEATFENCVWEGNSAKNFGGALAVNDGSDVTIYNSQFLNNRTNLQGHNQTSAGGAIHIGNSNLRVYNSNFVGNQAGYVGGAIYAIGNWDKGSLVIVANSIFMENKSIPAYTIDLPTEGGAFHAEDLTTAVIYGSRFVRNEAMIGGGVNLYRAVVDISNSLFQDNKATGIGVAQGFGGAISATSNDTSADGLYNRRASYLSLKDTIVMGTSGILGQSGGGLYIAGDTNRMYGLNGVQKLGTVEENRARAIIERVIFFNTDVQETNNIPGTGIGGSILADLAYLTVKDSLLASSDALGANNSSGGGMALINNSFAEVNGVTFANNKAGKYGGALFLQGSTIQASNCQFIENQVGSQVYGAAIFAAPDDGRQLNALGWLSSCVISNNQGLPIFDDDRTSGPINDLKYNSNKIYLCQGSSYAYKNALTTYQTVEGLNNLVVNRQNGTFTKKSETPNISIPEMPPVGYLQAVPSFVIPGYSLPYYLSWAWSGTSANLNEVPLTSNTGITEVLGSGVYTLTVTGVAYSLYYTVEIRTLEHHVYLPLIGKDFH
jgi:hypothetical protein